jgi:hypothetical protein
MPQVLTSSDGANNSGDAQWTDGVPVPEGTTIGDLLVWNGTEWEELPAGANGEVLTSNGPGTIPSYNPAPAGTVPSGTQVGDMLHWDGANWTLLPAGADGEVITSNGPGTLPTYQTIPGGGSGTIGTSSLDYIGQGETGPTKTTTVFDGAVIAEQFVQIGDTLYTNWAFPDDLDNTVNVTLEVHFYVNAAQAPGTAVSFQLQVGASNGIAVNTIVGTITVADELVAGAYLDAHADFVLDAATYLQFASQEASNFRITRVSNTAAPEPTDGPRVHLITMFYTRA